MAALRGRRMARVAVALLVIVVMAAPALPAEPRGDQPEPDDRRERPAPRPERMEREDDRLRPEAQHERMIAEISERVMHMVMERLQRHLGERLERGREDERLGTTLRLVFEMMPREDDQPPVFVLAATRRYHLMTHVRGEGGHARFNIGGRITPLDDGDAVLLNYETGLDEEWGEKGVVVRTEGSVVLKYGEKKHIAQLGKRTLSVTCTEEK